MADKKLFFYRGFPLIRSGNTIFYGSAGDAFAARLTIKDTKRIADADVPNKIMVQLLPNNPADMAKARKGDYIGFYEALDTAHVWLTDALFG
ncbi:MAG: hypothetical protein NC299_08210 [Lachnospiraceae bacterium]|nr:hypothetical protein [Ruminococcus sp.]MCM1275336.1 hypothetical protein [Lachnospiraceae bacterium]